MFLTRDNMVLVTGKRAGLSVIGGLGNARVAHLSVGASLAVAVTEAGEVVLSRCKKRFEIAEDVRGLRCACASAGVGHMGLVTVDGEVLASGYNAFGQVGQGEMGLTIQGGLNARVIRPHFVQLDEVTVPEGYRALAVAAGSFHTLYLLAPV